ncbi:MAG TPA: hypothetical protein VIU46_04655 [Gallionellaceae bacterium]
MKRLSVFLLLIWSSAFASDKPVEINIQWEYKNFAPQMALYEVKGFARLWDARSVASLADAPVGARMPGTTLELKPGQYKRFVLVVQNPTDKPLYFFAAPHVVQPPEEALGFKFKCLCVNRAYTVGPHETWYRVVEFRLSPDFAGQRLTVMHTIIGIDEKRADAFSKSPLMPDM